MGSYTEGWKKYRRIEWSLVSVFLGPPLIYLVGKVTRLLGVNSEILGAVVLSAWFVFFIVSAIRFQTFSCPRCGEWFSGNWWYNLSCFARKCVHCGLPKYGEVGN
jgi:hypothetical protein